MPLFWFYSLFYGALGLGSLAHRYRAWGPRLMRAVILFIEVPIFVYSYWHLDLSNIRALAPIPIMAVVLVGWALILGGLWARRLYRQDPAAQGSFILASGFSNIGTTGGAFIAYMLYGLPGLALGYLFLLPYPVLIFTLGFSLAKHYASAGKLRALDYFKNIVHNIFSLLPLLAITIGLALSLSKTTPPAALAPVADAMIKLDLGLMCFAIGLTIEWAKLFQFAKAIISVACIKFLLTPLAALILIFLVYGHAMPLEAKVILIQAAMPPAIYAVVTVNLFKLHRDLANAIWLANAFILIPVAGLLYFFLRA